MGWSWEGLEPSSGRLGAIWNRFGVSLGGKMLIFHVLFKGFRENPCFWFHKPSWTVLGRPWGGLESSWGGLEPSWDRLGRSWGCLGDFLSGLGTPRGP